MGTAMLVLILARATGAKEPPKKPFLPIPKLFQKHGVDDKLPGEKIDALLKKLEAPDTFKWRSYDTDKDGRLSKTEINDFRTGLNGAVEGWREKLMDNPEHIEEL